MKLLFDHHLLPLLARIFQVDFPDSVHVMDVGLQCASDKAIWNFAKTNHFTIVTKDSDYHDLGMRLGFPPLVLLVKRGNCSTKAIAEILRSHVSNIRAFLANDTSGILILF